MNEKDRQDQTVLEDELKEGAVVEPETELEPEAVLEPEAELDQSPVAAPVVEPAAEAEVDVPFDVGSAIDEALAGPMSPPIPSGVIPETRRVAEPAAAAPARRKGKRRAEVEEEDEAILAAARAAADERARIEAMIPADAKWYVIHTYAGYENKVKQNLEHRIESMGMLDQIFQVVVPVEEEVDIKDGQRRIVERKIFPGYVLVRMILSEESWGVVRNTPAVTGFVGSGTQPTPLRPEDVDKILRRMEADEPTIRVTFRQGQNVRIVDGPFTDFHGIVDEIDMDRGKVRLMVNFFGRETPVELDFLQVEKV